MSISKFYFHDASSGVGGTLPTSEHSAQTAEGSVTGATTVRSMDGSVGSSQQSSAFTHASNAAAHRNWHRTFISAPLATQTITAGNWQLSAAAKEANANSNFRLTAVIYAWRPSTGAVVGSLISDFAASTNEALTTQSSVTDTTIAGTAVDILDGDVLVCEIWRDATASVTSGYLNTFYYDGTTEASTTNCASFLVPPQTVFVSGETGPTLSFVPGFPMGAGAGANNTTTISLPTAAVGDAIILFVGVNHATITSTGVSSSKTTGWTKVANFFDSTNTWRIDCWKGTVTSTGTHTATVTYSASVAAVITEIDADAYHSSRSSPVWWIPASGGQHDTAGTTFNMPTLVPSVNGAQAYVGLASPTQGAGVGSTAGYSYNVLDSSWVTELASIGLVGSQTPNVTQSPSGTATVLGILLSDAPISGTGSIGLKKPALAASGTVNTGSDTGTGSIALKKPAISIAAKEKYIITGSAAIKKPALQASGHPHILGTGSVALKKPALSVSAFEEEKGTGSIALKKPAISIAAKEKYIITGSVSLKKPALSQSGSEKISGTGSIGMKKPSLSGTNILSLRLYPNTDGPANGNPGDDSGYVFGLSFKVTSDNYQLDGWWHWVASDQDTAAQDFALWEVGVGYVVSSKVTSGTFTQNAWNFVACNTPIPLTNGTEYRAVRSVNKGGFTGGIYYSDTAHYFDSGAGSDGITNGALVAFNAPGGGTNPEPASAGQMTFNSSNTDVTASFPTAEFNESNYWLDVQVSVAGITGVSGTGSIALKKPSLSASAVEHISGSGSVSLKKPAISIAAKEKYIITGSVGLKKPALSGSGPAEKISATGSASLKKPALALVGRVPFILTGGVGLKKPALLASGGSILKSSAAGGTSGTTVSTGNSGGSSGPAFDATSIGAGATFTFDNAHAAHGSLSYKSVVTSPTNNSIVEWTTALTGTSLIQVWFRMYVYLTANPANQLRIFGARSGSTTRGNIAITTSGKVTVLDASGTQRGISTASVTLNQWVRIEGFIKGDASAGALEAKLFNTDDATSPDETVTSATNLNTGGTITRIDYGDPSSTTNFTFWLDDLGASPFGYMGPAGVTGTGSVALKKPGIQASGSKISGTGSLSLKKPALSASGPAEKISGTGSASLKKPSISISAREKISGTGGASLKKPSISVAAKEKYILTGSVSLKKPGVSGTARETFTGTGSMGLKKPQLTISAKEREAATGSISLKKPSLSASGTATYHTTGTGSIGLKKPHLSLTGDENIFGTGSIHMKKMRIEAHEFSIPANALFAMWPV